MEKKVAFVVLGSPRSGTSALTRLLPVFGIDLGDEMVPPNANNPRGFWEDTAIQHINTKLLKLADRHLGWPGFSRSRVESSAEYGRIHRDAKKYPWPALRQPQIMGAERSANEPLIIFLAGDICRNILPG